MTTRQHPQDTQAGTTPANSGRSASPPLRIEKYRRWKRAAPGRIDGINKAFIGGVAFNIGWNIDVKRVEIMGGFRRVLDIIRGDKEKRKPFGGILPAQL